MDEACEDGIMSDKHRKILRRNHELICRDLHTDQIIQKMKHVFSADDEDEIKAESTQSRRADRLLELLPRAGEKAFKSFLNALMQVQPWMAKHLAKEAGIDLNEEMQGNPWPGMSKEHREILRKYSELFSEKLHVDKMVPKLLDKKVFDSTSAEMILGQTTQLARVEMLLNVLPRCGPDAFLMFYECLNNVQPRVANDFKQRVKGSHPAVSFDEVVSHQESDKKASSNIEMVTGLTQSCSSSYSLSTPWSDLPEDVNQLLQNVLDEPADGVFDNDWKMFYQVLGLPEGKEEKIVSKGGSPTSHVVKLWIRMKGKNATVEALLSVLTKCYHGDLVNKIEELLRVKYKEGFDVEEGIRNIHIQNDASERFVKNIPAQLKPALMDRLNSLGKDILGEIASELTERRCPSCSAAELLSLTRNCKIRFLFRELKIRAKSNAEWMRTKLPAGSTGPMKADDATRLNEMNYLHRRDIVHRLTGNGDWKILASKVGLKNTDIQVLDRGKEPAEDVLSYWEVRKGTNVGALYDLLVDCGLGSIADDL